MIKNLKVLCIIKSLIKICLLKLRKKILDIIGKDKNDIVKLMQKLVQIPGYSEQEAEISYDCGRGGNVHTYNEFITVDGSLTTQRYTHYI